MRVQRRTAPVLGLTLFVLAVILTARSLDIIPSGLGDLIARAWPSLLILAGLILLLRDRLPLSGLIALVLTVVLVAGVAFVALNTRAAQQRTDNQQVIRELLPENVSLLRLRVQVLSTDVELLRSLDPTPQLVGTFIGSLDNQVNISAETFPDQSVTLTLAETTLSAFPSLETVGRGTLQLELPPDVPVDVEFRSQQGDIILNLSGTQLERLNVDSSQGDVIVTLPEYAPQFSEADTSLGTIVAQNGDLTLRVPDSVAGRFDLSRGGSAIVPQFDPEVYNYLQVPDDRLEARLIDIADIVVRYALVAPRGLIRLDVPDAASS